MQSSTESAILDNFDQVLHTKLEEDESSEREQYQSALREFVIELGGAECE